MKKKKRKKKRKKRRGTSLIPYSRFICPSGAQCTKLTTFFIISVLNTVQVPTPLAGRYWVLGSYAIELHNYTGRLTDLVEKAEDLATSLLPTGLLVIHDSESGGEHDVTEATRWQHVHDPLLNVLSFDIEARGDDTALVEATVQVDNDFASSVIIDNFELTDVTVLHHDSQEFNDDL